MITKLLMPSKAKIPPKCIRGDYSRSREDLNLRRTLDPYLISSEAHSTGLCDDS